MDDFVSVRLRAGLTDHDVAHIWGVSARTVRRWRVAPPAHVRMTLRLLSGDIGQIADTWDGWRVDRDGLHCPSERLSFTANELRELIFERQIAAENRRQLRRAREALRYRDSFPALMESLR